ncbi:hypothetical protein D3C73_1296830 [compost metagenome]
MNGNIRPAQHRTVRCSGCYRKGCLNLRLLLQLPGPLQDDRRLRTGQPPGSSEGAVLIARQHTRLLQGCHRGRCPAGDGAAVLECRPALSLPLQ